MAVNRFGDDLDPVVKCLTENELGDGVEPSPIFLSQSGMPNFCRDRVR
jgi:hypothetical protein